ncbi:hypothetical protein N5D44_16820 [Acinetobacter junii]|jgi:hypothetical protein|uniref:Uncharacterized protein n=3 Tax=Moraxellaceae TaxID=468 RepID=V9M5I5_9GAMM|nr:MULTISPECIES: hypothetical protein [Acinetobacter]AGC70634.1 hypothetical protein [Acinetobacter sp. M131]MDH1859909.1 hypothetical protein [Acinetobacter junii]QDJ93842.1 hypothetical protein AhaeAN54_017705 [Acinetobacter haemolyticus]QHI21473.1 hypothetical protein AhaeAN3_16055 [Acinetobacter haemolyticus]QXR12487.1 hypothetical protein EGT68_016470 [Acinetobacter junii]
MSDQQIAATLKAMSDALHKLSMSLESEKQEHIELLKKLNEHLTHSQDAIEDNIFDFLKRIELTELLNTVNESKNNIQSQKENIDKLNEEIESIDKNIKNSLNVLDEQTEYISKKIQNNSNLIQTEIVKNVSVSVKESITTQFLNQFSEQNQNLVTKIIEANEKAVNVSVSIYKALIIEVEKIKSNHIESLENFKEHVNAFNAEINSAIKNIGSAFSEVKEHNINSMNELYESCASFQNNVIEKINAEVGQINEFFDQKISDISKAVQNSCSNTLQTMSDTEQQINQKSKQLTSVLEKNTNASIAMTEKIIEKQENIYKNLCKKLNFKYFSFNSISILIVTLVILCGLNIAATMRYEKMKNYNIALVSQNQKLQSDIKDLEATRHDLIVLTKQSVNEVRKKFPQLQIGINCKSLD